MENQKIKTAERSGLFTIELNNPSKLNCMDLSMLDALDAAVSHAENSPDVKAVLVKGAGGRAFSTGADLKAFNALDAEGERNWILSGNEVFNHLEHLPKPTIAYIDGYALGGGLELALTCDFRIGTAGAIFSSPELGHGWLPGWGGMTRLRKLFGEPVAKEVVFLGEQIKAERALQLGLLHRIVENESCSEMNDIIQKLLSTDSAVFALAKVALADQGRTTKGADLQFDVLALQASGKREK